MPDGEIGIDDPRISDVRKLLERHLAFARAASPPQAVFALDVAGLLDPAVTFFSFRASGELLAVGALKHLDGRHAELKSMHTVRAARGRGIGRAMVTHLIEVARSRGYRRLSLETGSMAAFAPARSLYESAGFRSCEAFGGYRPSQYSTFMTLELDAQAAEHRRARECSSVMIKEEFAELLGKGRQGVLTTLRRDGWPQLSNVTYAWFPQRQVIRVSTTADRAKTHNLRRDPRVSFHVTSDDFWNYVVVDGHAELSASAADPYDEAVEELIDLYRTARGEHPDWDDYRAAMVRDKRLVIRIPAERAYGLIQRP